MLRSVLVVDDNAFIRQVLCRVFTSEAQAETAVGRISITKDVPILRIDHASIKGELLGMWQALHGS